MDVPVSALRAATSVMRAVPAPVATAVGRAVGMGMSRLSADERTVIARNLRRVIGHDPGRLATERHILRVYGSYAQYWVDVLRLPGLDDRQIEAGFTQEGMSHLDDALAAGTAPIVALPHLGGWEWAARWLVVSKGLSVAAVVEDLEPPELFEWFRRFREDLGLRVITLGPRAIGEVAAALADGQVMCLLADRDISGSGVEVEFFGERTRLPGGPALMALRTGAPLLPTAAYFRNGRCHAVMEAPLDTSRRGRLREDVTRVTQELARTLERQIRRAPEQWHLLQPNWPSDLEALGRSGAGDSAGGDGS